MKIRFRIYEFVFVSLLAAASIIKFLWINESLTEDRKSQQYAARYMENGIPYSYNQNVLFPQIAQVVIVYLAYLCIAAVVFYGARNILKPSRKFTLPLSLCLLALATIAFLTALGINFVTYYAHPHLFNYGGAGFDILAWFGYNDRPMESIWTGFDHAIMFTGILALIMIIRETLIRYIERDADGKEGRIILANQVVALVTIYLCIMPLLILFPQIPGKQGFMRLYLSFIPSALLTGLVNVYYLFPLHQQKPVSQMLVKVVGVSLFTAFFFSLTLRHENFIRFGVVMTAINLLIVSPLCWLIFQQKKDRLYAMLNVSSALTKSRADLNRLRYQINPHFLFNSLNTLYGTALTEKAPGTASGIQQLGDMMRFMLHQNHLDFIPLRSEIGYLQNFVALQHLGIRLLPDIAIKIAIEDDLCEGEIPPMVLIPFVENAFKHGISNTERSWIFVEAKCDGQLFHFSVRNSLHRNNIARERSGIGIPNVVERLNVMFGNKFHLDHGIREMEYIVLLTLPLKVS